MSHPQPPHGRYRKVQVRTWNDENFRGLSDMAKLLWFFLLTGPQTGPIPGLYRAGRAALAEELDWPLDDFYARFDELAARGMVQADWKARLVWLPNALKHNMPESPNVVKSWRGEIDLLPECDLKRTALAHLRAALAKRPAYGEAFNDVHTDEDAKEPAEPTPKAWWKAPPEALPEGSPEALPIAMGESGTGTGTGTGKHQAASTRATEPAQAPPAAPLPAALDSPVTSAATLSIAMRKFGINANPGHLQLATLAAQGVTPDTVQAACEEARRARPDEAIGIGYVIGILNRWKTDAAKLDLAGATAPKPNGGAWWATEATILAKGTELGMKPRPGEQMPAFKGRIDAALANGGKPPAPPGPALTPLAPPPEPRSFKPEGLDLKALIRQVAPHAP